MGEFKIRSRNEDHGSMSMYGRCGTICCCKVGAIAGGKVHVSAPMLKPVSCMQASLRMWAMQVKAA